jgi:hypothetical protein
VSSSRDEPGRQKPADSGTTEPAKQVKPVGVVQSAEPFPVRDSVNSRPMCTSHSRIDVYHQKERGGG